ncbi:MAG: L51/S25/CI-B8 domain-containing protein [Terriglobus roseus]|nr:L51/S25/CI-B8 domain-containing protein [Terriglobus roseus]
MLPPLTSSAFLKHDLAAFAKAHPAVEITVSPRPQKHPLVRGHYINGREKAVCVRNLGRRQVLGKAELLARASGDKLRRVVKPVASLNQSVRGVWDPHHGGDVGVRDVLGLPK